MNSILETLQLETILKGWSLPTTSIVRPVRRFSTGLLRAGFVGRRGSRGDRMEIR